MIQPDPIAFAMAGPETRESGLWAAMLHRLLLDACGKAGASYGQSKADLAREARGWLTSDGTAADRAIVASALGFDLDAFDSAIQRIAATGWKLPRNFPIHLDRRIPQDVAA